MVIGLFHWMFCILKKSFFIQWSWFLPVRIPCHHGHGTIPPKWLGIHLCHVLLDYHWLRIKFSSIFCYLDHTSTTSFARTPSRYWTEVLNSNGKFLFSLSRTKSLKTSCGQWMGFIIEFPFYLRCGLWGSHPYERILVPNPTCILPTPWIFSL